MRKVIGETRLLAPCDTCGTIDGVKLFQFGGSGSTMFMAWCPACAGEVVKGLCKAFPSDQDHSGSGDQEQFPAWVTAMQKL